MKTRENLRNVAIIAHVDHGKTTLVDALFRQGGLYRSGQVVADRVMDSGDQERERGITILAKATSVCFDDITFQLVDTPGHADFGGEVERTLRLVDGVLLLVDAAEGPLPQTRFVMRKALSLKLPFVVAINKIDRQDARPTEVLDEIYDLLIDLGADEQQLTFPVLYTQARNGTSSLSLDKPGENLRPLVDALVKTIPPPVDLSDQPFCLQVNALGYDDYLGRLVIGRVAAGKIKVNQLVKVTSQNHTSEARITGLFRFQGANRIPIEHAQCGDIVALAGVSDINIGSRLADASSTLELPEISVDEPTVAMVFQVNDGPFSGRSGGKFVTSRHLRDRLHKEAYANVSIRVEPGDSPDQFRVLGRGELQLAVVIETLRRELFELCVRTPEVVLRELEGGGKQEPTERLVIDVPSEHLGTVTETLGRRRAQMLDQKPEGSRMRLEYIIPTRGLFGLRNLLLTNTRGTAILHSVFEGWIPFSGPIVRRSAGALVSDRTGTTTAYALFNLQPRGTLFVGPGEEVYEGMVVGEHSRDNDLDVNVCREKKLTNVRAAGKDDNTTLAPPRSMTLERCLEWINEREMVEITPNCIRLRKRILAQNQR